MYYYPLLAIITSSNLRWHKYSSKGVCGTAENKQRDGYTLSSLPAIVQGRVLYLLPNGLKVPINDGIPAMERERERSAEQFFYFSRDSQDSENLSF